MAPGGYSRLVAATLMLAASTSLARAKDAVTAVRMQNYDGIYAVFISTRLGDCDKAYHWMIMVTGGRVSSAGDTPMEASGRINARGIVDLQFERFGQVAKVTGKIAKGSGSGTWFSLTLQCSGSWRATRRGWAGQ